MCAITFKQKTLHSALSIWSRAFFLRALWAFCIVLPGALPGNAILWPASAHAQTLGAPVGDHAAELRLIVAPGRRGGLYDAGVEIVMPPGSHTYWQQPGEAGVPPVFAFNGSQNVAKAEVKFPVPTRISEEGIEAFGYADKVTFPVVVTPIDAAKPAVLKVDVSYAVCSKICIPAHGAATLTLDGTGLDGAAVAAALAEVPISISAAQRHDLAIARQPGTAKPSWIVTWSGPSPVEDLFAVAPEGFYFETKRLAADRFSLTVVDVVSTGKTKPVPVSLTLARKAESLVTMEMLDATTATR